MERLLAQLRIPKTDVLTLENHVSLEFIELLYEMVIVLLPQVLDKLELGVSLPNIILGDLLKVKFTPLSKKRKNLTPLGPSNPSGKEKEIPVETHSIINPMMPNCIIWNARGSNNNDFHRHCKSMVSIHQPSILALLETRMVDHSRLADELGFS